MNPRANARRAAARALAGCGLVGLVACAPLDAPAPPPAAARAGTVRPDALRARAEAALRLAPDRRVLDALIEIELVLAGTPRSLAPKVEARPLPEGFAILISGEAVGELPADASLDAALSLLERRARRALRDHPPGGPTKDDARPASAPLERDPLDALGAESTRLRRGRSPGALRGAARASVGLCAALPARGRGVDLLHARALALFSIAIAADGPSDALDADRATLAEAMGYPDDAARARARLAGPGGAAPEVTAPPPLRPSSLAAQLARADAAARPALARAAIALALLDAARGKGDERALRVPALAGLASAPGVEVKVPAAVPNLVYGWLGLQPEQALARFELDVRDAFADELGPALDAQLHRAALRAIVDAAVLALPEAGAPELANGARPAALRARDRLTSLRSGAPDVSALPPTDEAAATDAGAPLELLGLAARRRGLDDAERATIPAALAVADARPAHRAALAPLLGAALFDEEGARALGEAAPLGPAPRRPSSLPVPLYGVDWASVPAHLVDLAAVVAFDRGDDAWLRGLPPARRAGDVAELRLLLRAAAAVRARAVDARRDLAAELPSQPGLYGRLAAMLIGALPPESIAATPLDAEAACEALCFLALRAGSDGRAADARGWLHALGQCPSGRFVTPACVMPPPKP